MRTSPPPTKEVVLDGLRLEIPRDWNTGPSHNGRWWAGSRDGATTLHVQIEALEVQPNPGTELPTPSTNTDPYVSHIVDFLKTIPLVGKIAIDRIQSGHVVHAREDYEEDGAWFRSYRWYSIIGRSNYVTCVRLFLHIRTDVGDASDWVIAHFSARAHAIDLFARSADGSDPPSLKDLSVDDLFGIRILDDWSPDIDERSGIRSVWCWPRDLRLGKLMICYEHNGLRPEHTEGRDPEIVNRLADQRDRDFVEDDERVRLSRARFAAPLGVIIHIIDDEKPRPYAEEEIDRLYVRHHQWFYVVAGRRNYLVAFFNFTVPLRWIHRPEAAETVALLDREIWAMRLLPAFDAAG